MTETIRVLLVEDDEAEAFDLRKRLNHATTVTFDVTHVISLKSAFQVLEFKPFDIVLLDLSLPDSHGYDTVVEFAKGSSVPFVVLTGNDDMATAMRTIRLGAQDYLLKDSLQTRSLERAVYLALGKVQRESTRSSINYETMNQVMPMGKASVALVIPPAKHLIDTIEEIIGYVRVHARNHLDDVDTILRKNNAHEAIYKLRDLVRDPDQKRERSRRRISDEALRTLVDSGHGDSEFPTPQSWEEAEAMFSDVTSRGGSK